MDICEPWPVVVEVTDLETFETTTEVQIRCGCRESLALDFGHV